MKFKIGDFIKAPVMGAMVWEIVDYKDGKYSLLDEANGRRMDLFDRDLVEDYCELTEPSYVRSSELYKLMREND